MSSPNPLAGIISTADQTRPNAAYLPLEYLITHVYIADVSVRVVLSQLYFNASQDPLKEAHYVFPIPAGATVCSFEVRTDDGRRLKGVVKEINQAQADYEEAIRQGKLAGLLEQVKHDGTIPPTTHATISLSYVMDLSEDNEHDTVRFQIPHHVGARYGAPPTSVLYHGTAHRARVSITVEIEMASTIMNISSPTHTIEYISQNDAHTLSIPDNRYACVRWTSMDTFLDNDFLLVVQAAGLDRPRCFAETLSSSDNLLCSRNDGPTTILALTIVPRFSLPTLSTQEYLFLIDCSPSMKFHQRIEIAKKALGYLLRMLPPGSTIFNIFSSGGWCTSLWPSSQHYNDVTLRDATYAVDAMQANMLCTELLNALTQVFLTKSTNIPTSVVVLTDGKVSNTEQTIEFVRQTVSSASVSAPIRVFTLGVGDGASTELCQGIADVGKGACSMTLQTEDLMAKSVRLLNAMRVSTIEHLVVDWNIPDQALQAPDPIPTLSPGIRTVVTSIVSHNPPAQVVLRGRRSDGGVLEYTVPVLRLSPQFRTIHLEDSWGDLGMPPLLHTLAAHRYIQGLERGTLQPRGRSFDGLSPLTTREFLKNLIVELGTQYQVASSLTTSVAVDVPNPPSPPNPPPGSTPTQPPSHSTSQPPSHSTSQPPSHSHPPSASQPANPPISQSPNLSQPPNPPSPQAPGPSQPLNPLRSSNPPQPPKNTQPHPSQSSNDDQRPDFYAYDPPVDTAADEVVILPDPHGGSQPIICTAPPLSQASIFPRFPGRSFWSRLVFRPVEATNRLVTFGSSLWQTFQKTVWNANAGSTHHLLDLSLLQAAGGSFSLNPGLSAAIGISEERLRSSMPSDLASTSNGEQIWATAVAVAFMRSKYARQKEMWETLEDKAPGFCLRLLVGESIGFEEMVKEALY